MTLAVRSFRKSDTQTVIKLWQACGLVVPQNNPLCDIERKLRVDPDLLLVGELDETIVATVMVGYEGHRGWINYLAVSPAHQRKGFATTMMREAERLLLARGCPKINLQVRETNAAIRAFYEAIGYRQDPVLSMGKRLIPDHE